MASDALIETCKLNRVNSEAWLAWVLERIQDHPVNRIGELMPWAYQAMVEEQKAEASLEKQLFKDPSNLDFRKVRGC